MVEESGVPCVIERHGQELHVIVETEAIAISLMPDPPGIWMRQGNHVVCSLSGNKNISDQQKASH
ncbi:hypothetical protein S7335_1009 [Synechococcus sp. PCC 7335]|uniref:hypothetical protein n=1 Tax=Synechococcus sp. (strain ATCC 29403 / PCC 7335) TaxID=91464 RepID=UPI00017EC81D|nr:hypothetical protein [Synechococcus sp. PCC 7335]EDX82707.1 hypothetical protein S7335_1009 [Synechococcus sp. PCC 7335]